MLAISGSLILDTPNVLMLNADTSIGVPPNRGLCICAVLSSTNDRVHKTHNNTHRPRIDDIVWSIYVR
jgi:hypothetical protein